MRTIVYIGRFDCPLCDRVRREVIKPLKDLYPDNVEIHMGFDNKIAEVDARCQINHIPLVVIEKDGVEEFRFSGMVSINDLEDILLSES